MELYDMTYEIRGAIYKVHEKMGIGLLEHVYEKALVTELVKRGLHAQAQVGCSAKYDDEDLGIGFKIDILVENTVAIEIKSVEMLHNKHFKQLLNYVKLAGLPVGYLVNFNVESLVAKESLIRIAN